MSPNTSNKAKENNESIEKNKNNDPLDLLYSAQEDYVRNKINKNPNYFDTNVVEFNNFITFLNISGNKYTQLSNEIINFSDKQKENIEKQIEIVVAKSIASRKQLLQVVPKYFDESYVLDKKQSTKIYSKIAWLSEADLKKLLGSEKSRLDFLVKNKVFKNIDEVVLTEDEDFFQSFQVWKKEILEAQKKNINIHEVRQYFRNIYSSDIEKTLQDFFAILNKNQKQLFLSSFIKELSFTELEKIWLINESQLENIVKSSVDKYAKSKNISFSKEEIQSIVDGVDKDKFFIPVDFSSIWESDLDKLIQSKEFLNSVNAKFSKTKEEMYSRSEIVNELENAQKDEYTSILKKFIKNNKNIHPHFAEQFSKVKIWDTLKIYNVGQEKNHYLKITELKGGSIAESAYLTLKDVTHNGKLRPEKANAASKNQSYTEFIEYLEGLTIDYNKHKSSIEVEDYFSTITQQDIQDDKVEVVPEENEISNAQECKYYLDQVDPQNSEVPVNKTSFVIWAWEGKWVSFSVTFDDSKDKPVILDTGDSMTYADFIEAFKENECERFETVSSPEELLQSLIKSGTEVAGKYKNLKIKNGKIIQENGNDEIVYDYFISEKSTSKESVFCDDLSSWEYFIGQYKKTKETDRKKWKKDSFKINENWKWANLSDMYQQIIQNGLVPYSPKDDVVPDQEGTEEFKQGGSALKRYLKWASIWELIWAFKIWIDAVWDNLERGSKLKSAKLAMKIASITWKESDLYTSMQQVVEAENKKQMEDVISQLKWVDSDIMIKKILKIITNKDSEEFEKEAALMTIVWKYGTLYPKKVGNLCNRRGEWMWYRAFWGRVDDPLFKKIKAQCEGSWDGNNPPTPFTEEVLMERLLKDQKDTPYNRRSKLHKDYGWALKWGIRDEQEDGANKTSDMATLEWKVFYIIDSMAWWEVVNGSWALDNAINHNWNVIETAKIPFVFTITNIAKDLDQWVLKKEFINRGFWTPYTSFLFNLNPTSRELFFDTVEQLVQDKGNKSMQALFKDKVKKNSWNKWVWWAAEFWDKYWDELYSTLQGQDGYILAKSKTEVKQEENESNEDYQKRLKRQELYKNYHAFLSGCVNDTEYEIPDDKINDGRFDADNSNTVFAGIERMCETQFKVNTDGKINSTSKRLLSESLRAMEKMLKDPNLSLEEKKNNYIRIFKPLWATAYSKYNGKWWTCSFISKLQYYWLDVYRWRDQSKDDENFFNPDDPIVKNDEKYNKPDDDVARRIWFDFIETKAYERYCQNQADKFFEEHVDKNWEIRSITTQVNDDIFWSIDEIKWKVNTISN